MFFGSATIYMMEKGTSMGSSRISGTGETKEKQLFADSQAGSSVQPSSQLSSMNSNAPARPSNVKKTDGNQAKMKKIFALKVSIYCVFVMYMCVTFNMASWVWANEIYGGNHSFLLGLKIAEDIYWFIGTFWFFFFQWTKLD